MNTEQEWNEKKKHGRRSRLKAYNRIVTILDVLLLAGCIFLFLRTSAVEKQYQEERERANELERELAEDEAEVTELMEQAEEAVSEDETLGEVRTIAERGTNAIEILKLLFPQQFVLADEGAFHFFDINRNLRQNEYDLSSFFVNEKGLMVYTEDGQEVGYRGIDVSQHNGAIDWEQVRADGVDFVYIRAGIRGYGSGKLVEDARFAENIEGAKAAGLNVGVYFFTQAVTEEEAVEEADFVLELIRGKEMDIPVAIDVEKVENNETEPRTKNLSKAQYTANVKAFCERIREAGYDAIVYGNGKTFAILLDINELESYEKWFADYISSNDWTPYFPYHFRIWQYDSTGRVNGISGDCDLNLAFY